MNTKEITELLLAKNVNEMTEDRNGFTYLSWAYAWGEVLKVDPEANYKVRMFDGVPYCGNGKMGYMVFTELTINGLTRECYLPVMDSNNKAMKDTPYTYKTKFGEKYCEAVSMFDVNKAIQRCLAKNIAMFGLGLYIYKGEDLPNKVEDIPEKKEEKEPVPTKPITQAQKDLIFKLNVNIGNVCEYFNVESIDDLTSVQASEVIARKRAGK